MADGQPSFDVLNTKVEFQGKQLEQLAEETAKSFVASRNETNNQLGLMRDDFKGRFDKLGGSIDQLVDKLETSNKETASHGRVNWYSLVGTGLSAIGVSTLILGGLATLRLTPIENDIKTGKDERAAIVATLDKITNKLDNFESRAEITEKNGRMEAALAEGKAGRGDLERTKVSKSDLDGLLRERDAEITRLREDIEENKRENAAQAAQIVDVRIASAVSAQVDKGFAAALARIDVELDRRATAEALAGVRLRLDDQRDRINLLSNRQQFIYERNFLSPTRAIPPLTPQGPVGTNPSEPEAGQR